MLQSIQRIESYFQGQGHYDVRIESEPAPDRRRPRAEAHRRARPRVYAAEDRPRRERGGLRRPPCAEVMVTSRAQPAAPWQRPAGAGRARRGRREPPPLLRPPRLHPGRDRAGPGGAAGERLRLTIPIREGPRQRVVSLAFEGVEALDHRALAQEPAGSRREAGSIPSSWRTPSRPSGRSTPAKGYVQAQVSARQDWNPDHTLVDLTLQVLEGPRQIADRIIVRGNQRTQSDVIRKHPGAPAAAIPSATSSSWRSSATSTAWGSSPASTSSSSAPASTRPTATCWSVSRRGSPAPSPTASAGIPRTASRGLTRLQPQQRGGPGLQPAHAPCAGASGTGGSASLLNQPYLRRVSRLAHLGRSSTSTRPGRTAPTT